VELNHPIVRYLHGATAVTAGSASTGWKEGRISIIVNPALPIKHRRRDFPGFSQKNLSTHLTGAGMR
jgi:hypothetical protein